MLRYNIDLALRSLGRNAVLLGYYSQLAIRSLRRNVMLTLLTVATIGVGIGASMSTATVMLAMASDPIPEKSSRLFTPQIDVWGPDPARQSRLGSLPIQLTYRDAVALMQAHRGSRQAVMYAVRLNLRPAGARSFAVNGRATSTDFFSMFGAPFGAGGPWSRADDEGRASVAVLGESLARRLFPAGSAVGKTIDIEGRPYRIVGVLDRWRLTPQFYDPYNGGYIEDEQLLIPFSTAIEREFATNGGAECKNPPLSGWHSLLNSDCVWIELWAELPSAAAVRDYRQLLYNYVATQQQSGRFHWQSHTALRDVREWLVLLRIVPDEMRLSTLAGFGFLLICLINAVGLMLARFSGRAADLGVRRALGASRADIFLQCVVETAVVSVGGGVLGLGLTMFGLWAERSVLDPGIGRVAHLDPGSVVQTLALAAIATVCTGLYPTWRASRIQPAWQLEAQ